MQTKEKRRIFSLLGEPTAENTGRLKWLYVTLNVLLPLISAVAICVMSLKLAYGNNDSQIFLDYFSHPQILLLNFIPILLLWGLFYCITRRSWIAFLLTAVPVLLASAGNYFKLKFRNDPFMFSDISAIGTALGVADGYDIGLTRSIVVIIIGVVLITLVLYFFAGYRARALPRIVAAVLIVISVFPLWNRVYSDAELYNSIENYDHIGRWSYCGQYISKGFVYPFIHSICNAVRTEPDGYDETVEKEILAAYPSEDIPDDRKVNIIVIQLEAYADLTELGIEGISDETYAFYHSLEEESYTGHLINNVFAGGTIDTERSFLTGDTVLSDYRKPTQSYVRYLKSQGYTATGSHPCPSEFYNRRNVNEYLGFDEYYFFDGYFDEFADEGSTVAMDNIFFPKILELYRDAQKDGQPVFSFNVSYQGHGPYDDDGYYYSYRNWDDSNSSDSAYYIMNNYLGTLQDTGVYLEEFIEELRQDSVPVVLVLYGDHKPWLGDNSSVYYELGINFDLSTEQGFREMYATKYLIWANDAAKEALGTELAGEGPDISPCFLMNLVFDRLGWTGDSYLQYMSEVMNTLPVIHSSGIFYADGKYTVELDEKQQALYDELMCVEYYRYESFAEEK